MYWFHNTKTVQYIYCDMAVVIWLRLSLRGNRFDGHFISGVEIVNSSESGKWCNKPFQNRVGIEHAKL